MVVNLPLWLRLLPFALAIVGTGTAALLVFSSRRIIARLLRPISAKLARLRRHRERGYLKSSEIYIV
jgi:hypothetical protein